MTLLLLLLLCSASARLITVSNRCSQPIWLALIGNPGPDPFAAELAADESRTLQVSARFSGRFWARTGCHHFDHGRNLWCETGNCDGRVNCTQAGKPPVTLAEFTYAHDKVFYDLSVVDGYNLGMRLVPSSRDCPRAHCAPRLDCPPLLRKEADSGQVIACRSACEHFNDDLHCCRGEFASADNCDPRHWPMDYTRAFRAACPRAYTYAFDDAIATLTCGRETDFEIEVCGID